MRRLFPFVAMLLAGSLLLGPSLAGAQADGDETIVVVAKVVRFAQVDLGAAGETPGDVIVFKDALWDEAETDRVGTDWVECTLDFGTVAICNAVFRLSGRGTLASTGVADFRRQSFAVPITGGTGDFQHVTGQVQVTFQDETQEVATLRFSLSGTTP
jgi:dirigent-like protein